MAIPWSTPSIKTDIAIYSPSQIHMLRFARSSTRAPTGLANPFPAGCTAPWCYWEAMTTMPRRLTQSWYSTVQRSLVKDVHTLFTYEEHSEHGSMYGLFHQDLRIIKPNYESMSKSGALRLTDDGYTQGELRGGSTIGSNSFKRVIGSSR